MKLVNGSFFGKYKKKKSVEELTRLKNTTPKDMWKTDLSNLKEAILKQNQFVKEQENYIKPDNKSKKGKKRKSKTAKTAKKSTKVVQIKL